ncbi:hypothetical protein [Deinococcus altitudinis]|uniref:hypothetical protein n=1 Tax=Deinococcus altitudinis TaxID=468914 RepID=UPI003892C5C4
MNLHAEVEARFGSAGLVHLAGLEALRPLLAQVSLFLARNADDLPDLIRLAQTDPEGLLYAATVKEERG